MLVSLAALKTNLSQIQECLEELRHLQRRDTLEDRSGHLLKLNFMGDDELHPKNPITYVLNVEVSLHVCSFCHGFGHLLTNCRYRSSQVEVQPILPVALPPRNPPIATILSYPNTVLRNSDAYPSIGRDKGEFPRFPNLT
jgi:hypothetical protein